MNRLLINCNQKMETASSNDSEKINENRQIPSQLTEKRSVTSEPEATTSVAPVELDNFSMTEQTLNVTSDDDDNDKTIMNSDDESTITSVIPNLAVNSSNLNVLSDFINDPNFIIPNPKLLKFRVKLLFQVKLIAISPSDFWIRINEPSFDSLVNEMTTFYFTYYHNFVVCKENIKDGLLVAANVNGSFYRAEVIQEPDSSEYVNILFIDVGTSGFVLKSDIHYLHKSFARESVKALRATLAGVLPIDGDWSENAKKIFLEQIEEKTLNATIRAHNRVTDVYELEIDNSSIEHTNLSKFLIREGLAKQAIIKSNWFAVPVTTS